MLPYTPLHHLLLADVGAPLVMTSGNVSDEPIAYRRRRRARAARRDRRRCSSSHDRPIQTRTDDSVRARSARGARRCCCAARAATCPSALALPVGAARPCSACGAELKSTFCLAKGEPRLGRPPHRRPRELRDAALVPRRASSTSSGCSRSSRRSSRTTCTPTTSRPSYALEREGVEHVGGAAPPRAPRRVPGRARRDAGRRSGAIFDGTGLRPRRHGLGRRAAGRRPARLRARRASCSRSACPAATRGDPRAVADGLRLAGRGAGGASRRCPPALAGEVDARRWARGLRSWSRTGRRLAADHERRAAVRRGRGALRAARTRSTTRARRRSSSRRRRDPAERGAYPLPLIVDGEAPLLLDAAPDDPRAASRDLAAGAAAGAVAARFHDALAEATAAAPARLARRAAGSSSWCSPGGVFQNRLLLERTPAPPGGRRPARADARVCCRPTTAASPSARPPWRRRPHG